MQKLNTLLISDGKPGHYTQSLGLLQRLNKHFLIQENKVLIKPKIKLINWLLRYALVRRQWEWGEYIFEKFYRVDNNALLETRPDLVLSTGGDTCGVNALLAKKMRAKNLYIGSLRGHDFELFSAVISATPMPKVTNNIVLSVAPSLINYEQLEVVAHDFLVSKRLSKDKPMWVMLLGGTGSGYFYTEADMKMLVDSMFLLADKYQIKWLLTTSRRTGKYNEAFIRSCIKERKEIAYAVYYISHPEKVMNAFLGLGDVIFCTEDSTSMINEAVIAQKPVITLRAKTKHINKGHFDVVTRFENDEHIKRVAIKDMSQFVLSDFQYKPINVEKGYAHIFSLLTNSLSSTGA